MAEEPTIVETATLKSRSAAEASAWLVLPLAAVVVVLYRPVLRLLIAQWWDDPNYSHGFLIPLFAAFVVWERREELRRLRLRPAASGLVVLLVSLAVLFLGLLGAELFLARLSLIGVLVGIVLFLGGWPLQRVVIFPVGVLLLMIPLPTILYNEIVFPLQLLASRLAAGTLQGLHILPVVREGNILILPNATLEVADACSGIRSLMSLLAFTVMYGYFAEPRKRVRLLLYAAVVPIAVFSNAARVMFAAVGSRYWGDEVVEGWPHLLSGIVLFVCATGGMVVMHCLIRALMHRVTPVSAAAKPAVAMAGGAPRLAGRECLLFVILALAALGTHFLRHGVAMPLRQPLPSIPLQIEGWQGADESLDEPTRAMLGVNDYLNREYQRGADSLGLYIGYYRNQATGDTIHSPKNCLPGSGWQPVRSSILALAAPNGRDVRINSYVIQRGDEQQVVLYWYQAHGRVMASEYQAKFFMIADALRWNRTDSALVRIAAPVTTNEAQTREQALRFAQQILPKMDQILP